MLSKYICDLLYRYDNVVIPGFGCIMTQIQSARIDENTSAFFPPSKILTFNADLKEGDDLMVNYIAETDQISTEAAYNFIKFQVDEWLEKLQETDLEINDVGVFMLDGDGKILFEPDPKSNFLADSFGLDTIEKPEIYRVEKEPAEEIEAVPIIKIKKKLKNKPKKNRWFTLLQYASVLLLVLAVGWFFSQQIKANNEMFKVVKERKLAQDIVIKKRIQEATFDIKKPLKSLTLKVQFNPEFDTLMPNDAIILDSTKVKLNLKKQNIQQINTPIAKEIEKVPEVKPEEKKPLTTEKTDIKPAVRSENYTATSTGRYYIIAGAFKDSGNAIDLVKELKKQGYNAVIVNKNSDVTLVSYGMYASMGEAESALAKIILTEPEAWILEK